VQALSRNPAASAELTSGSLWLHLLTKDTRSAIDRKIACPDDQNTNKKHLTLLNI
jgi:hypothetical protein